MGEEKLSSTGFGKRLRDYARSRSYVRPEHKTHSTKSYTKRKVVHDKLPEKQKATSTAQPVQTRTTVDPAQPAPRSVVPVSRVASTIKSQNSLYGQYASTDPKYSPQYDMKRSAPVTQKIDNQMVAPAVSSMPRTRPNAPIPSQPQIQTPLQQIGRPAQAQSVNYQSSTQKQTTPQTIQTPQTVQAPRSFTQSQPNLAQQQNQSSRSLQSRVQISSNSDPSEVIETIEVPTKAKRRGTKVRRPKKIKQPKAPRNRATLSIPIPRTATKTRSSLKNMRIGLKSLRQNHAKGILYSMAGFIFAVGLAVSASGYIANRHVEAQIKQISNTPSASTANHDTSQGTSTPSSTPPSKSAVANYTVAPTIPRYLDIPALGVHARVLSEGVDSSGTLVTPYSIYDAGWYNASAQPGNPGGMLIEGHSGIGSMHGIFHDIGNLNAGDQITVTRGDGQKYTYTVVKKQVYDANHVDMSSMMVSQDPSKPGLNLISCTGDVIPGTVDFNQRVIVYAVMQ